MIKKLLKLIGLIAINLAGPKRGAIKRESVGLPKAPATDEQLAKRAERAARRQRAYDACLKGVS